MLKKIIVLLLVLFLSGCCGLPIHEANVGNTTIKSRYLTIWTNILNEEYVLVPVKGGYVKVFIKDDFPPRTHNIKTQKGRHNGS